MRPYLVITMAILILVGGCSGGAPSPAAGTPNRQGATITPSPGTTVTAAVAVTKSPPATIAVSVPSPAQGGLLKEALTAREAFAVADPQARSANSAYRLYDVMGCTASSNAYSKDEHLVAGGCMTWLFRYTRPMQPGDLKGYHELLLWVAPRGILKQEEKLYDKQVAKLAKGATADWRVDSAQAIQIAEREGGKEYRLQNPQWDPGRAESDRNALLITHLEFVPYFDVTYAKGKDLPGAKSVVWTVKYPPIDRYVFVIDAYSGELLLRGDAKNKP